MAPREPLTPEEAASLKAFILGIGVKPQKAEHDREFQNLFEEGLRRRYGLPAQQEGHSDAR